MPDELPEFQVTRDMLEEGVIWLPKLIALSGMTGSTSEARRLILQGGVKVDGEKVEDAGSSIKPVSGMVIQVGKRKFTRFVL